MEDLIVRLHIEENNRRSEKRGLTPVEAKENVVEYGQSSNKNKFGKRSKLGPKTSVSKKPEFQEKCFNCDNASYKSTDFKQPKKKKKNHKANVVDSIA